MINDLLRAKVRIPLQYEIQELQDSNADDWEKVNESHEQGSFFHTLKWKGIVEKSLDCRTHYFMIYRGSEPVALCPFAEERIKRFNGLGSPPPGSRNLLIVDSPDPVVIEQIVNKCKDLAHNQNLSFILTTVRDDTMEMNLFRNLHPSSYEIAFGNMILDLRENSPDTIWKNTLSKKRRKRIRRFDRDGFTVSTGTSLDRLKTFYRYYRENLLHQGGSPFPFSHFEQVVNSYSENEVMVTLLARGPEVAGGLLTFIYHQKKTMYVPYASINRNLPSRYTTLDYMCWDTVKRAAEMGVDKVSLGYAPSNPNHPDFIKKQRFGCKYEGYRSLFFPTSSTFKFAYSAYGLLKRFVAK